jgi:uncharacterized integral membrane protein (TIGR00698 family)
MMLALAIALAATVLGTILPIVGAPVFGIVIGALVAVFFKPGERFRPGLAVASRLILQVSVVVLGAQLSLPQVIKVGLSSLPVMVGTLAGCLVAAYFVGRWLGIVGDIRTLIGVGTGICGASAIAAVTPVIGAVSVDVAYAVSTIFLFNIAAVLTFPFLGHLLGLSQHAFGLFAGTAVNDMSSVVATSSMYGSAAANYAVVVKLTRTLLIIPICFGLAALAGRKVAPQVKATRAIDASLDVDPRARRERPKIHRLVPLFLVGFVLLAAANSAGLIPVSSHHTLSQASMFLITIALSAIGLSTDLAGLRRTGPRPLMLGAVLWFVVSATSLGLQIVTGAV